jgi:hypothetical protein
LTNVGASVGVAHVAIVALLAGIEYTISADIVVLNSANRGAAIAVGIVTIVALLDTCANERITTAGILTKCGAGVGVASVAIVALFAGIDDTITAEIVLGSTSSGAAIAVLVVTIVALFKASANETITAAGILTSVGARIGVIGVCIVALLAVDGLHESIATRSLYTEIGASVCV